MAIEPLRTENQADFARFSPGEYERRFSAVRNAMAERDLDALVIWGESSGWGELPRRAMPWIWATCGSRSSRSTARGSSRPS